MIRIIINRAPQIIKYTPIHNIFIAKSKNHQSIVQKSVFNFSKIAKKKIEIKPPSINMSKFNQKQGAFFIYQNKEGFQIKAITISFLFFLGSFYWAYTKNDDEQIKINNMIMGAMVLASFLLYQYRVGRTLKLLLLDKEGQNIVLTRFKLGGFSQQITKARVQILKGIGKGSIGGTVIKGGGVYGLQQRNYWFQSKYILQKQIFEQIVQGHRVKVNKYKTYD